MLEKALLVLVLVWLISLTIYLFFLRRRRLLTAEIVDLMQGAAWTLVRFMENNPRQMSGRTKQSRQAIMDKMFENAQPFRGGRPQIVTVPGTNGYVNIDAAPLFEKAVEAGNAFMTKSEAFASDFWFKAQGARNGIYVFLALIDLGNITAARIAMIEHMKRQRDELENKKTRSSPHFPELKGVLGLPTLWPDSAMIEKWEHAPIPLERQKAILEAMKGWNRSRILNKLHYHPFPENDGEKSEIYYGERILSGMREYIR